MRLILTFNEKGADHSPQRGAAILATISALVTIATPVVTGIFLFLPSSSVVPTTVLAVYVCVLTTVLLLVLIRQGVYHARQLQEQELRHSEQDADCARRLAELGAQHGEQLREQEIRHAEQLRSQEVRHTEQLSVQGRAARYAPAMIPLRKSFGSLANASWTMLEGDRSEDTFIRHLQNSLQFLAESFSLITDNPCRTSIKVTSAPANGGHIYDGLVTTLCRSDEDELDYATTRDQIGNNTDFRQILEDGLAYFISNDLVAEISKGYQNSHWTPQVLQSHKFKYRATIVWPISRARARMSSSPSPQEVIGFLCVDTPMINSFHETFDVPIGMTFAGGLHLALNRFREQQMRDRNGKTPDFVHGSDEE
ncbi:hypothetical protein [Amycolatopsis vancoresmycina]|uniref:Uncharacterized protein n=1 Tax=Amycolatopsis vancoresmycina DSM 44592 TaxID=1292037 RepID=R1HZJ9_9PSEU|nr:hypothetical protein [Amycolatopsis vancoresmycina]EOD63689.1 hypothetical protein H480_35708 [Amycolatopsis vancoresmycina DSM 44592]